ncbi:MULTISPECIES: BON domain-containing protein [Amycolatopsis]|uniref:BON domain-containing protein n=1 Tax=Amycolatopsis tucumanensis TaxID=401106 RepID=A0ABP7IRM7_9PSEU|nr:MULTISPECIES: BON domain-containing protein [Amycolatopsis]MCF6427627.1 BON domain-containing protein [Amycolatopsis tucumanensis]
MTTEHETPQYRAAHLRRALAEDPRTAEMGVRVNVRGDDVHLSGEVTCDERRAELENVLHEVAPGLRVHNDVRVADTREPARREDLR